MSMSVRSMMPIDHRRRAYFNHFNRRGIIFDYLSFVSDCPVFVTNHAGTTAHTKTDEYADEQGKKKGMVLS